MKPSQRMALTLSLPPLVLGWARKVSPGLDGDRLLGDRRGVKRRRISFGALRQLVKRVDEPVGDILTPQKRPCRERGQAGEERDLLLALFGLDPDRPLLRQTELASRRNPG